LSFTFDPAAVLPAAADRVRFATDEIASATLHAGSPHAETLGPEQGVIGSVMVMLVVAAVVGIVVKRIRLPYTVALAVIGLLLALVPGLFPAIGEIHLTHDFIFFVLLPPLLFHGSLHMDLSMLHRNVRRIAVLALPGVIFSTVVVGLLVSAAWGIWNEENGKLVGLLFGAMVAATDPVSVLAIFKECKVPERLRYIVEGESLFNDGTAVVIFSLILGFLTGSTQEFHFFEIVGRFLFVCTGGIGIGVVLGYIVYRVLNRLNDHLVEVTITIVLAYGSFWLAENSPLHPGGMHLSGVLATVTAGLVLGNFGTEMTMSAKTRETVLTFWEVLEFLVNSVLFIMIGVQLRQVQVVGLKFEYILIWTAVLISLFGRALTVYTAMGLTRWFARPMPYRWSHVFFWGGLRGAIPIALVLSLVPEGTESGIPHAGELKTAVFALVFFSTVVQGLTMKPLLKRLGIGEEQEAGLDESHAPGSP
jgi:CPA1 family monovalent cation:H+ antiporter